MIDSFDRNTTLNGGSGEIGKASVRADEVNAATAVWLPIVTGKGFSAA
jgi:hypothetical protein